MFEYICYLLLTTTIGLSILCVPFLYKLYFDVKGSNQVLKEIKEDQINNREEQGRIREKEEHANKDSCYESNRNRNEIINDSSYYTVVTVNAVSVIPLSSNVPEVIITSSPLTSIEELLTFQQKDLVEVEEMNLTRKKKRKLGKLLVCHDMKGGYLSDKSVIGAEYDISNLPFQFHHWELIDIFCYFSHSLGM